MFAATYVDVTAPRKRRGVIKVNVEIRGAPGRLYREGVGEIIISGPNGTGKTRAILEYLSLIHI